VSEGELYLGMISGTSRDGVDAALAAFPAGQPQLRAAICLPYPADLAARLERLAPNGRRPATADLPGLDAAIAGHFADTALRLLHESGVAAASVRAIGSHGQTNLARADRDPAPNPSSWAAPP
jgi:anhydro-N-acetylmuramic acid kinase